MCIRDSFKRELAVFQELCKNPIPNVVEVTDVYIDEDKIDVYKRQEYGRAYKNLSGSVLCFHATL